MTETRIETLSLLPLASRRRLSPDNSRADGLKTPRTLDYTAMKVIPWNDIWTSLTLARRRGNDSMIRAFYEMLFRDAVFDDRGAWSVNIPRFK